MVSGIGETNTIAWSPDDRTIYFGDSSKAAVIYAADWNAGAGTFENRRIFVRTGDGPGIHDGSAMDAEGFLWTCYWQGWRIMRYAPDGSVDRVIELPVKYPTSCTFGGDDLQMLYVTTACWYQTADELAAQPLAGNLLAFEPGVRGLPDAKYAG
jgi:sugar lactone lactonase YvrE